MIEGQIAANYGALNNGLAFEFTREPRLLEQYHLIYEEQFRTVHSAQSYRSIDDGNDRISQIVVAKLNNRCIGGGKLSVRSAKDPHPLPIEMNDFRLEEHFAVLRQQRLDYGQIGRICLLPQFRGGLITRLMMWHLYKKAVELELGMVFGTAIIPLARVYRQNCLAMGLKNVRIHWDIALPEYPMCEGTRFYLISGSVDRMPTTEVGDPLTELGAIRSASGQRTSKATAGGLDGSV